MHVCRTIAELREHRAALKGAVGFVPTMGALHEGHLSLVEAARQQNQHVVASIFVNPTQFNSTADLAAYPRDEARDFAMFQDAGVGVVFAPPADEIYPANFQTYVTVEKITQGLEGEYRPGHFKGVATVVAKLFNIVQPTRAYFGQKDAQQVAVIQQMVRDLNFPVEIIVCPTLREPDGLAMSSRNLRLSPSERQASGVLHKALSAAKLAYELGERDSHTLYEKMQTILQTEPLARTEYISLNHADTLEEIAGTIEQPLLISMAVFIGDVRLIDNIVLRK